MMKCSFSMQHYLEKRKNSLYLLSLTRNFDFSSLFLCFLTMCLKNRQKLSNIYTVCSKSSARFRTRVIPLNLKRGTSGRDWLCCLTNTEALFNERTNFEKAICGRIEKSFMVKNQEFKFWIKGENLCDMVQILLSVYNIRFS